MFEVVNVLFCPDMKMLLFKIYVADFCLNIREDLLILISLHVLVICLALHSKEDQRLAGPR